MSMSAPQPTVAVVESSPGAINPSVVPFNSLRRRAAPRSARKTGLYDLNLTDLTERVTAMGQPAYRARQIFTGAYRQMADSYDAMTDLPKALKPQLEAELPIQLLKPVQIYESDKGDTIKALFQTDDGQFIETVLMLYPDRATVCVSCQVGCAVGCAFCATGIGGLTRNLTTGEMVEQVIWSVRLARERGRQLTNLVMMGMGEPLQNYAATMAFIGIINDAAGLQFGARRITISTSGILPRITALADEPYQVNLAVSLHAPNDALRDKLVPHNTRYPVRDLMAVCRDYTEKTGRRISFEYALMAGINDGDAIATELALLLRRSGVLCHVNIIPFNKVEILDFERPTPGQIDRFAAVLTEHGISTTVRYSRGLDIKAACGQLRAEHEGLVPSTPISTATRDTLPAAASIDLDGEPVPGETHVVG